jgi:hypothetical protein
MTGNRYLEGRGDDENLTMCVKSLPGVRGCRDRRCARLQATLHVYHVDVTEDGAGHKLAMSTGQIIVRFLRLLLHSSEHILNQAMLKKKEAARHGCQIRCEKEPESVIRLFLAPASHAVTLRAAMASAYRSA